MTVVAAGADGSAELELATDTTGTDAVAEVPSCRCATST